MLTVNAQVPANSANEFVTYAKANPGKRSGGLAQGTVSQLLAEYFNHRHGLDITSVPYRGGALVIPDMLGGRIHVYWPTPATGLTAALALFKRGIDVEVYEQSDQLKEIGAGIQISSNGTRVLFALGLETALANVQVRPERRELPHWSTGETWNWFDLGDKSIERFGTPHLMPHRAGLHVLLADAVRFLKPDAITLNRRCVSVVSHAGYAEAAFEDGSIVKAPYVIVADA